MQNYTIQTTHPAGYRDGTHVVTVRTNRDGTRYVSGGGFGCSRDYRTTSDVDAITSLLRENGMRLVSSRKTR